MAQLMDFDSKDALSYRRFRVGELLRHALSDIFVRGELRDPDLEGAVITVSEARVSPDLRVAKVYVSALGDFKKGRLIEGLKRATPYLKTRLGGAVRLRYIPKFIFQLDPSISQSERINEVLHGPKVRKDLATRLGKEDEPSNRD